jgi:AcrR family transcriptional regulator
MTRIERVRKASRQRREQEKQELRQTIISAAAELFLEQGYDHFSLRQVAERIGYSPTTIYLYFEDKDDLLFTIVDEGFVRFGQQLVAAVASIEDPRERLVALGRAYITFGLHNPEYYQLMFMQRADFLMQCRVGEDHPRIETLKGLQQAVQEAINAGALRPGDAESYSDALWAAVHGIVALAISMPVLDPARIQRAVEVILAMTLDGLGQQ